MEVVWQGDVETGLGGEGMKTGSKAAEGDDENGGTPPSC